jgi:hypothetical protein
MSRTPTPATPELNRLRAAAGLIPIIETGLADGKLTIERAALMASFCEWAVTFETQNVEQKHLVDLVVVGLRRLQMLMNVKNDVELANDHLVSV